jgi:hypothetical protein
MKINIIAAFLAVNLSWDISARWRTMLLAESHTMAHTKALMSFRAMLILF